MSTTNRRDSYAEITNAIIADLEKGIRPWTKPWASGASTASRPLRYNGEAYRGINTLWLWRAASVAGYRNPHWLTYRQAEELGGHVRRGEKSTQVVYAYLYTKTEDDDAREPEARQVPFFKAYSVFNVEQVENLPARYQTEREVDAASGNDLEPNPRAVTFFANTGAAIREDNDRAYYSILEDVVFIPPFRSFDKVDRYYSTLAHELTHWTGHPKRAPRKFPRGADFTPSTYAREELVAELGAAFLCADLGINLTPRPDHADYIGHWLEVLRRDKRAVVQAAAYAQRATDFLHALQPQAIKQAA